MLFKIDWQHNYKGEISNNVKYKDFESEDDARKYAKALSSGSYSVLQLTSK